MLLGIDKRDREAEELGEKRTVITRQTERRAKTRRLPFFDHFTPNFSVRKGFYFDIILQFKDFQSIL